MPTKTFHITNQYHPASGGIRIAYHALLEAANKHRRCVRLLVPGAEDSVQDVGPFARIYTLSAPRTPFFDPRYRMILPSAFLFGREQKVWSILRSEQPDLIEIADKYCLPYLSGMFRLGWTKGVPRPTLVGLSCERMDDNLAAYLPAPSISQKFASWYLGRIYVPQFDLHLANSDYTAQELLACQVSGHERQVHVCPVGVDSDLFHPGRRSEKVRVQLCQDQSLDPRHSLLLYVGRLAPEKNIFLLSAMMRRLANEGGRRIRLLVVGNGPAEMEFRYQLDRIGTNCARFLGHLGGREALANLYANCDAFVHPNPREPFGIAPLEALAAGIPLIAPASGGVLSYASNDNAWLTSPTPEQFAERVRLALSDAKASQRKSQQGRQTAEAFHWDKVTVRLFELYDELHKVNQRRSSPPRWNLNRPETTANSLAACRS